MNKISKSLLIVVAVLAILALILVTKSGIEDLFWLLTTIAALYTVVDLFMLSLTDEFKSKSTNSKASDVINRVVQDIFNPVLLMVAGYILSKIS